VVFLTVSLAGVVGGYRRSTREMFAKAGWDRRVLGMPLVSLCGAVGMFYWGVALYMAMSVDALALNTTKQILLTAGQFVVPFVLFFAVAAWRSSKGIKLQAAYAELPPE
jgi:hypothetical protein